MKGWHKENYRHSLAARGIKTSLKTTLSSFQFRRPEKVFSEDPRSYQQGRWAENYPDWPGRESPVAVGASPPVNANEYERLIYDYLNANVPGSEKEFDYQGAFEKLAPLLKRKVAEHGQMTKSDYIEAQMDYIKRRRHNLLHPESPVPLTPAGGRIPEYRGGEGQEGVQGYKARMELIEKAKELPAYYEGTSVMKGKPGIWADDFRTVRWKYLRPVGIYGVASILAAGTLKGEVNTERKEMMDIASQLPGERRPMVQFDLKDRYEEELRERPLQEDELNYVWDELYEENRRAHGNKSSFPEFKQIKEMYEDVNRLKKKGYSDKFENLALFDKILHAQHVTGSLLPVDVNEIRDRFNEQRAKNVVMAKRIMALSLVGKKDKLLYGEYEKALAKGEKPKIDEKQLKMGIKVEIEHTPKKWLAKKISLDHLTECPDYYSRLEKMESGGCK